MSRDLNAALMLAGGLSLLAALLHVAIIFGGAAWYRYFGAGERMARAAEGGRAYPMMVTSGIAAVLALWSAFAWSGAGLIRPLPMMKLALVIITAVYTLRGLALVPLLTVARPKSTPFLVWSSVVCLGYGAVHLVGLAQVWPRL